jgi:AbrB family looped-hinge helix DNA binding protein
MCRHDTEESTECHSILAKAEATTAERRCYLMWMKTSLSTKGRIVLPAEIRKLDHLRPGQQFEIERVRDGEYVIRKVVQPGQTGLVDWLSSCPVKGWFRPFPSDSTADIPLPFDD